MIKLVDSNEKAVIVIDMVGSSRNLSLPVMKIDKVNRYRHEIIAGIKNLVFDKYEFFTFPIEQCGITHTVFLSHSIMNEKEIEVTVKYDGVTEYYATCKVIVEE